MRQWIMRLSTVEGQDEDEQRRAQMIFIVTLGLIITSLILVPLAFAFKRGTYGWLTPLANCFLMATSFLALRWGRVELAAWIIIATLFIGCIVPILIDNSISISLFFAALPLLFASLTLRPVHIWFVLILLLVSVGICVLILPPSAYSSREDQLLLFGSVIFFGIVALLSYLGANNTAHAIQTIRQARQQIEASLNELAHSHSLLEERISERTAALQSALNEVETRARAQEQLLAENEKQRAIIREMSVPVIPVSEKILVMPLVGELDEERLEHFQQQALKALERYKVKFLVLDITGIPYVDSLVAERLLNVVQSSRLLGTDVILVGIRPEVAQTVVQLGLNLSGIRSFSSLQSALAEIYIPYHQVIRSPATITM
jgi:rsbT co-antagonist protein RsbR